MKTKINILVIGLLLFLTTMVYLFAKTKEWETCSTPIIGNGIVLGYWKADYNPGPKSLDNGTYYYKVVADIKRSQGSWPTVKTEFLKCDTLLVAHECSKD